MAKQKQERDYLAVFAKGTEHEATYPVSGVTRQAAKKDFCNKYLGYYSASLMDLVKLVKQEVDE